MPRTTEETLAHYDAAGKIAAAQWMRDEITRTRPVVEAALAWYAKTETGGDDYAERQVLIAACKLLDPRPSAATEE